MTDHQRLRLFLALAAAALSGCSAPSESAPPPSAQVQIRAAQSRTFRNILTAYGVAEPAASALTGLSVQYEARLVHLNVANGESVRKGQPLAEFAASAAAQLDLDKAGRDAALAAAEQARMARLRTQGLATDSELQAAENAAATARELRDSLVARMGAAGLRTLDAPREGIVDGLTVQPGDLLPPGTMLMRILQPDGLIVRLGIEPRDVEQLLVGQPVKISPVSGAKVAIAARVDSIDRRVDLQTRLAAVLVKLPRNAALLPGAAVRGQIVLATHEHAIGIPRSAVLYAGDQAYAFVADQHKARRRAVHVGLRDDGWLEVQSGIRMGEGVIISGNYELQDGMAIRAATGSSP